MTASAGTAPAGATIGVVTVLYNGDDLLDDFFASLALQQDVSLRLYVIDNSATDSGTRLATALAERHAIAAECVYNGENRGVAAANNQGIALALRDACTHVLIANNDIAFGAGTIATLLETMSRLGHAAATPKIRYHEPEHLLWFAGGRIDAWTARVPHRGMLEPDRGQYDVCEPTEYAPTCFMLVAASVFDAVGGMDERYFVYYDDTDFVLRMRAHGMAVLYVPQSVVRHKVSSSTGGSESPFSVYYTNRNRLYFVRKNLTGLRKASALVYFFATRIVNSLRSSRRTVERMWAGVRDGWALPIEPSDRAIVPAMRSSSTPGPT